MVAPRWRELAVLAGLWAAAILVKMPVIHTEPYWDEGLHYWTARHLGMRWDAITDIWGNPFGTPEHLLFQRPLFYLAFWLPAQGGFETFRVTHAVAASLLSPLAYLILRAHGVGRAAGILTGVAVATIPGLAMWGTLGLMDSLMTAAVGVMLWARATGRNGLLFAASVAAVWTKETAYVAVLGLLALEAWKGHRAGTCTFLPLRLDARATSLAFAAAVAPWSLMWAVAHDLALPGAENHGSILPVLDHAWITPWLVPVLLLGLLGRGRFLSAFGLAAGAFLVALQLAARDVPAWYFVPSAYFTLIGVGAAADAWWRTPAGAWARRAWVRPWPAATAVVLVALLVLVPNSPERDLLRPLSGDGGNSLSGSWDYELRIRDGDMHAAIATIPIDKSTDILVIDLAAPALYVRLVEPARQVYWDSSWVRTLVDVDTVALAARIEEPATTTLIDRSDLPMTLAIEETYADCIQHQNVGYTVLRGADCAGRAQRLEDAWRDRDPRF